MSEVTLVAQQQELNNGTHCLIFDFSQKLYNEVHVHIFAKM